jgi:hypothetical protein
MAALNIQLQPGDIQTDMAPSQGQATISLGLGNSLYSPGGCFRLTFQAFDGNCVLQVVDDPSVPASSLTAPGGNPIPATAVNWVPIWSTITNDKSASRVSMQPDGNLVVYDGNNNPLFASNTSGNDFAYCRMQDDGNLVIYANGTANPLWATNTSAAQSIGENVRQQA